MDTAATFANFAHDLSYEKLPGDVVEITKKLILDELGVMVVGSSSAGIDRLLALATDWGGKPEAGVLVDGVRMPAQHAALINATMGRAYDFDALHEGSIVHASAGSLPQCLALAERRGSVSGKELIAAMSLGMEFMIRLGLSFQESFLHTGRVTSVHHTTFGGALAGAKLLNLGPRAIVSALGLAYTQIGGNLQNVIEGTAVAQLQQGFAAQTSVLSAVLAEAGVQGPERVFQGEYGYYKTYHDDRYWAENLTRSLGDEFEVCNISVKYFPTCFLTHYANDAMIQMIAAEEFTASDIDGINVRVTKGVSKLVCTPLEAKRTPNTTQEALFSLPYTVAVAAVHSSVALEHLTVEAINDDRVRALAQKVTVVVDEELERKRGHALGSSIVEVTLKNGAQRSQFSEIVKGHPSKPMSFADCEEKFWKCVRFSNKPLDDRKLERLVDRVRKLETVEDVSELRASVECSVPRAKVSVAS
ncbi:MAG: MmgE/PrpD family protein [Betaproteobacteria bacterium]|nr:MmgE/PrpD family protein [Betaproteobacteria bacterium]MBI2292453.1 MmgE/PrpD family protein [Betaproteobacteria bacterium]MBI3052453.1 MmgE/PrpD family protein [Betaproteobacteria bacterium]